MNTARMKNSNPKYCKEICKRRLILGNVYYWLYALQQRHVNEIGGLGRTKDIIKHKPITFAKIKTVKYHTSAI